MSNTAEPERHSPSTPPATPRSSRSTTQKAQAATPFRRTHQSHRTFSEKQVTALLRSPLILTLSSRLQVIFEIRYLNRKDTIGT